MSTIADKLKELDRLKKIIKKHVGVKVGFVEKDEDNLDALVFGLHGLKGVNSITALAYRCNDKTITECPQDLIDKQDDVTNMSLAFEDCTELTEIVLPDLVNCTTFANCFSGCTNLTSITFGDLDSCTTALVGTGCLPTTMNFGFVGNVNVLKGATSVQNLNVECIGVKAALSLNTLKQLQSVSIEKKSFVSSMSYCSVVALLSHQSHYQSYQM